MSPALAGTRTVSQNVPSGLTVSMDVRSFEIPHENAGYVGCSFWAHTYPIDLEVVV